MDPVDEPSVAGAESQAAADVYAPFGYGTSPDEVKQSGCTILFVAFFVSKPGGFKRGKGERCNGCHESPMHITFDSAKITHPGACVGILTDMETDFTKLKGLSGVHLHRFANVVNRESIGKPSLMYERMKTYRAFVDRAAEHNFNVDIVLLDTDIVIIDNIKELFSKEFDYGLSVRPNDSYPIQGGVQLVHRSKIKEASKFLQTVEEKWAKAAEVSSRVMSFTGDQKAYADVVGDVKSLAKIASKGKFANVNVKADGNQFNVMLIPADKYNRTPGGPGSGLKRDQVKVLHYKGGRKEKMYVSYNALKKGGLKAVW
eukprot:CAMPEP_0197855666 /NCGR_PEP_ID=MMETSP1438-20131217/27040_1 /TAXON_ID=1461541 /ORGANISM="Pterosperma sp., Strain CCMP1384" /LENGTH=314 /DNA_ID=CAMNT_0043470857 /DNA_START=367 /DNA_END=1308 /DNA_ORIENTATION=-